MYARYILFFFLLAISGTAISQNIRKQAFDCASIDVLIVTDIGYYGQQLPDDIRQRALRIFGKSQAFFNSAFDVEFKFHVRDIITPTEENPFPDTDDLIGLGQVNTYMRSWLTSKGHDIYQYDLIIGMALNDFNSPHAGFCSPGDGILATIIMELRDEEYGVRLLAHEMGHAFGGTHDPEGVSLMSPISLSGSWSVKNREEINAYIKRDDIKKYFGVCSTLAFDGVVDNRAINFNWTVNYEKDVSGYVLYENGALIDSVEATGSQSYNFQHETDSTGEIVYWLHQISKWGEVVQNRNAVITIGSEPGDELQGHPNPFLDSLTLISIEPGTSVVVYNSMSQRVLEYTTSKRTLKLDTSGWSPGLYVVKNGSRVRRVIKR